MNLMVIRSSAIICKRCEAAQTNQRVNVLVLSRSKYTDKAGKREGNSFCMCEKAQKCKINSHSLIILPFNNVAFNLCDQQFCTDN